MSSLQMICVCMKVELPEIFHFKNDEQNVMELSHMDMPGQEGSDVRIKNPPHGCSPSTSPGSLNDASLVLENHLKSKAGS